MALWSNAGCQKKKKKNAAPPPAPIAEVLPKELPPAPPPATNDVKITIESAKMLGALVKEGRLEIKFTADGISQGQQPLCKFAETENFDDESFDNCSTGNSHQVTNLIDDTSYSFAVRVQVMDTGDVIAESKALFTPGKANSEKLKIAGIKSLIDPNKPIADLRISHKDGGKEFNCKIDGNAQNCSNGNLTIDKKRLLIGNHELVVSRDADAKVIGFCVGEVGKDCQAMPAGQGIYPMQVVNPYTQRIHLGSSYQVKVPDESILTSWSSNYNLSMQLISAEVIGNQFLQPIQPYACPQETLFKINDEVAYCVRPRSAQEFKQNANASYAYNHARISNLDGSEIFLFNLIKRGSGEERMQRPLNQHIQTYCIPGSQRQVPLGAVINAPLGVYPMFEGEFVQVCDHKNRTHFVLALDNYSRQPAETLDVLAFIVAEGPGTPTAQVSAALGKFQNRMLDMLLKIDPTPMIFNGARF